MLGVMPLSKQLVMTLMKIKFISSVLLLVFFTSIFVRAQDPPPPATDFVFNQWKEFVSTEGGFKVLMPGVPAEVSQPIDSRPGAAVAHFHALTTKTAEYTVGYTTFGRDLESMQASKVTLDGIRDRIIIKESGKLLSETDLTMEGHPGRALIIEVSDGIFWDQYFLVGSSLYTVTVFTPTVKVASSADGEGIRKAQENIAKRFLDSFKLATK